MTLEEKYTYWLELADYDLESANAMFKTGRWFYVVFMCQQAIEKLCADGDKYEELAFLQCCLPLYKNLIIGLYSVSGVQPNKSVLGRHSPNHIHAAVSRRRNNSAL